ncbi:AraC family transcriptional regulator [Aquimarina sp. MMG016]|uniref:helix-turn-helix domain-containing protein n=1 Tax=Aquimarina sp. MMG016 TaxID=2822690 RepID=UPI001B3A0AE7|nr:AraC family transcriptional regulator [Aquimarina sp. MMG016]MBQ4822713.1 helix-turn-helix transcriptional regulator [Aquimarina sp. MMG016]
MINNVPKEFEYQQYLREILIKNEPQIPLYIATEKDFEKSDGINYPYRSHFYVFGLLHESECKLQVGINTYNLKKKSLTIVGPGIVRNWISNNWNMNNTTVFFKESLFKKPFYDNFLLDYDFFKVGANHVIELTDEAYSNLNELLETLEKFKADQNIATGILFSILEFINSIYLENSSEHLFSRNEQITREFNDLLTKNYRTQKSVRFYADNMNLSSKHLSDVLKETVGKTVKQSIEALILIESQSLLKQTAMEIKEIMYWLGFEDQSYFTKFFKKKIGLTPSDYRSNS